MTNLEGLPNKSFDLVVTIFGAMFAPKPAEVAKEVVRVTRPGGRIVMGNWIPNDPTLVAQILKISSAYTTPPPEGFVSPMTWGIESNVIERFAGAGISADKISFERDTFVFNYSGAPSALVDEFRNYYGPTMNAFDAAEKSGRAAELQKELEDLFNRQNTSADRKTARRFRPQKGGGGGGGGGKKKKKKKKKKKSQYWPLFASYGFRLVAAYSSDVMNTLFGSSI